ncbi:MAG: 50S ribosomal protein L11 methyltransferase [Butyrivibrio sp.]|nr:50S ribosomal protein L11 methyltransferase [Butyrivibrio sp.]
MKWKKYTVTTTTEAEDLVSDMLTELGAGGVQIEDNTQLSERDTKAMFVDILPELSPDDGIGRVSFFLESDAEGVHYPEGIADEEDLRQRILAGLEELKTFVDVGSCEITTDETEDKDWINNWKQYFKPFAVGNIVIKPTWEEIPEALKGGTVVDIDPGIAFGTGSHETTQLVIKQMLKYVKPGTGLLDVGTGSGILSVVALKLGAASVMATDLDPNAIIAARENMEANKIPDSMYEVIEGNIIDDEQVREYVGFEKYDVVTANILADIIIPLLDVIAAHMKLGAVIITSGIIDMKEEAVKAAFEANKSLEITETTYQGEWVSITARRVK